MPFINRQRKLSYMGHKSELLGCRDTFFCKDGFIFILYEHILYDFQGNFTGFISNDPGEDKAGISTSPSQEPCPQWHCELGTGPVLDTDLLLITELFPQSSIFFLLNFKKFKKVIICQTEKKNPFPITLQPSALSPSFLLCAAL